MSRWIDCRSWCACTAKPSPVREVARLLRMGPSTERKYRNALAAAGVLEGPEDDLPELAELRAIVEAAHPRTYPRQEVSTAERHRSFIEAS